MDRNYQNTALINWVVLLIATTVSVVVSRYVDSIAGLLGSVIIGLGLLTSLISYFQTRLEERERLEKLEFDELTRAKGGSALFTQDAETFPAQRSREQFERFLVPAFTILLLLIEIGAIVWHWKYLEKSIKPLVEERAFAAASFFGLQFFVLFLLGKFSSGVARLEKQRLLRASSGLLLLGAYISLGLAATIALGAWGDFTRADIFVARFLTVILGLIAIETLIGLLLEIYRPRVKGKAERVLYESRLVGLLGQPEGIFRTAAHALDYQFGFKVSETWFYRFLEKTLAWLILAQTIILLLSTCFVFVEVGEQALLERFGRPVTGREVLGPGLHLKLPFPIDRAHRYRTEQIQSFVIGVEKDDDHDNQKTVLWSVSHEKEENMLVASHQTAASTNSASGKKNPPVNLLSVSIPVQYQITNLLSWAYNHQNAGELLEKLATREVVRYLVSADVNEIMSSGRAPAAAELLKNIQASANAPEHDLGVHIVFVGLQDIHPPVAVASEYERVVGAIQLAKATKLVAESFSIETNSLSRSTATNLLSRAEADSESTRVSALARAALFTNQIPAYSAAPTVYSQRAYLQALTRGSKDSRKYVIATTNAQEVIQYNLEEKIRSDLVNRLAAPPTKK